MMIEQNLKKAKTKNDTKQFNVNEVRSSYRKMKYVSDMILFKLERTILDTRGQYIVENVESSWMKQLNHDMQVDNMVTYSGKKCRKTKNERMFQYFLNLKAVKEDFSSEDNNSIMNRFLKRLRAGCFNDNHQRASKRIKTEVNSIVIPIPSNGKIVCKKEMVEFYERERDKNEEVTQATLYNALRNANPPRIACSLYTFQRTIEKYLSTGTY